MIEYSPILVLRQGTEGLSMSDYARELRNRLPDHEIRHASTPGTERDLIADARVVTGVDIGEQLIEHAGAMQLFASVFAGTEHLPLDQLSARDVAVTNASGIHAPGIAEQAIGSMLIFARGLHEAWRRQNRREWRHFQSSELNGSRVMVVGLGAIGSAVIRRLEGFGVDTVGVRFTPEKGGPADQVVGFDTEAIHTGLAETDYLVIASPLTDTTRGLIGPEEFATMPPTAVLINVARGPIVDTNALLEALRTSQIRGAALDVTDPEPLPVNHPLWRFSNVLITPHTGGHTPKHWSRMADIVGENVRRLESGEGTRLLNQVAPPR